LEDLQGKLVPATPDQLSRGVRTAEHGASILAPLSAGCKADYCEWLISRRMYGSPMEKLCRNKKKCLDTDFSRK